MHPIREIENCWIPMSDGARLAARIWLPEDAETNPVPSLLEYIPYRKSDYTAPRDALRQPYLAAHGYAVVRVDLRGSGDSDGVLLDEYLPQEQADGLEVLAWMAAQPWCTGNLGMMGISWGGFNSLQIAAHRPPNLKAIMPIACTDDRYADDVHYMGGCLLASQMLPWAAVMFAYNAAPPDPRHVGEQWRPMWQERLEATPTWVETWMRHQRRDEYWKQGSVCENYAAIEIPVYVVGGWADSYNNCIPRLLANLKGPRKGLIGPWAHKFPENAIPGPSIGFLQESLRWWDYWLKGVETGIMAEPMVRCWIQEHVQPAPLHEFRPGRWVGDPSWPSPYVAMQSYFLNSDGGRNWLGETAAPDHTLTLRGRQSHGLLSGSWGAYGLPGEAALDQQGTDGEALSFTSAAVAEPLDLLGRPEVTLTLAADQPLALVAVRLCAVAPTGTSTLISWGQLNLTHRESHEFPTPLTPGEIYRVTVELNVMGYQLPAGYRWRVSVSPTYARHAWPSPVPVTLSLVSGAGCVVRLPIRETQAADADLPPFAAREMAPPLPLDVLRSEKYEHRLAYDVVRGVTTLTQVGDAGRVRLAGENGLEWDEVSVQTFRIGDGEPLTAEQEVSFRVEYQRGKWQVRLETASKLTATATHFWLTHQLEGFEGGQRVFVKNWAYGIERDLG
ncbi:MAG: CocE/NonD family hydrolase [Chloroflexi bacterium]|nr:CocE/NonD family hydrolase [Chloroflexota bacterium]